MDEIKEKLDEIETFLEKLGEISIKSPMEKLDTESALHKATLEAFREVINKLDQNMENKG